MLAATGKLLAQRVAAAYSGAVAADFTTPDAAMLMRLVRDTWQFSAAKSYHQLRDITLALVDQNGKQREWRDFKEAAGKVCSKYNEVWLRTEYNFAVAASQNAARWTQFEKEADIIPNLQYQTAGDSYVRDSHAKLDGVVRPIRDDFWRTHYPPNGWGCRCEAIQAPGGDEILTKSLPDVPIPELFRTNLAQTGVIYPKNHPYYSGVTRATLRKDILYLPPENTYQSIVLGDHEIEVHPLHGVVEKKTGGNLELEKNLATLHVYLAHNPNAKVKLLPIIDNEKDLELKKKFYPADYVDRFKNKCGDALIGDEVWEFEEPKSELDKVKGAFRKGLKQSNNLILYIKDNTLSREEVREALRKEERAMIINESIAKRLVNRSVIIMSEEDSYSY